MAALQEMQGHLMVPQPCSHLTAPPVQAGEGDLFHCSKALALEKSCEKMQLFSLGKKNRSVIRFMFLIAKKKYRERSNRAISA